MANEIAAANPALDALRRNLGAVRSRLPATNTDPYLRLMKDGTWVFGADNALVKAGTAVAINPMAIQQGYVCWERKGEDEEGKNKMLGENMFGIGDDVPTKASMPDYGYPWKDQLSFDVMIIEGAHAGVSTSYKATSHGGMSAGKALLQAIEVRLASGTDDVLPIVELGASSYIHTRYGKTYVPEFIIVGWSTLEGDPRAVLASAEPAAPAAPVVVEPEPTRRRRAVG